MANHEVTDPALIVGEGTTCLLRIISIESDKQRLGLSLKDVSDADRESWGASEGSQQLEAAVH